MPVSLLKRLRHSAGLSQESLALQSGVSDRTVRGIESGAIKAPQGATLAALARTLGLVGEQRDLFVQAWRLDAMAARSLSEMLDYELSAHDLTDLLERQATAMRDVHRYYGSEVGPDRLTDIGAIMRTFVPVDGARIDRIVQVEGYDSATIDLDAILLNQTVNCRPGRRQLLEPGVNAFELLFDRPVPPGKPYTFGYQQDVRSSYRGDRRQAQPEVETLIGVRTLCPVVSVQVTFDASCLPAQVWRVEKSSFADPSISVEPITLSPFCIAHTTVENARPGIHGIGWSWPQ
jgi:transcriptional regulator with XRE-family HTH domain